MQIIELHDEVRMAWIPRASTADARRGRDVVIELRMDHALVPTDETNLARQAAELMTERFNVGLWARKGTLRIDIQKKIPVGAGLGGGSADGAAVLLGLAALWKLDAKLSTLCDLGAALGADVPFCVMGQARADTAQQNAQGGRMPASPCALATGIGTKLKPIPGLACWLVLSKPPIAVSTAEIYRRFDEAAELYRGANKGAAIYREADKGAEIYRRFGAGAKSGLGRCPDTDTLVGALAGRNFTAISANMVNMLEQHAQKVYPAIAYTKSKIEATRPAGASMSGSGPTVFAVYESEAQARAAFEKMRRINKETFLTRTMLYEAEKR